jgi:regulator of replication initiation timing
MSDPRDQFVIEKCCPYGCSELVEKLEADYSSAQKTLTFYVTENLTMQEELKRLRNVVQSVLDDATPETYDRATFRIDSDVYWACFDVLQEGEG